VVKIRGGDLEYSISGFVESLRNFTSRIPQSQKSQNHNQSLRLCGILEDSADTEVGSSELSLGTPLLELESSGTSSRTPPLVLWSPRGGVLEESAKPEVVSSRCPSGKN